MNPSDTSPTPSESLQSIAGKILSDPHGILAADESNKSADKRFESLNIPSSPETHRKYRQLLLTTPNIEQYLSGVIFYDETIRQATDDGTAFPQYLIQKGIIPGIKVDKGLIPLDNFADETITEGLDGLADRLKEYYGLGARFAKWRAAFGVTDTLPSLGAIHANMHVMARYAAICQSCGIVPIVEPEVIYDSDHTIERSAEVTQKAIEVCMAMLQAYRVDLTGVILKTSMVLAGKGATTQSTPEEVSKATLDVLRASVPKEIAGIVFLSGGQTPAQARDNLQAIGSQGAQPWPITFSFSRAVQDPAMKAWGGKDENVIAAQTTYFEYTKNASLARQGKFTPSTDDTVDMAATATQDS
jgi:fructose-bisphosphate aldolase class I